MSRKTWLQIYVLTIHGLFFALTIYFLRDKPLWFIAIESILLVSVLIGFWLNHRSFEALAYIRQFQDLLTDRSYATRLTEQAGTPINELVQQFNRMLSELYEERIKAGEQRGFLEHLLQATPSAVIVFDFEQRISLLNHSAVNLLGIDQYQGKSLLSWSTTDGQWQPGVSEQQQQRSVHLLAQLHAVERDRSQLIADSFGHRFRCQRSAFYDRGFLREFLLIDEISDELESSEKTTYEKLVRVLAHEVNNTVAATGSVLQSLLFYQTQLNELDRNDFVTAIDAVKRRNSGLGEFIERFTRVVKMPEPDRRTYRVIDLVRPIEQLYRETCRERHVQMQWRRCDEELRCSADRNLIEQALQNIIKNAIEAAETTAQESGKPAYIAFDLWSEGEYSRLAIIDSGNRLHEVPPEQLFTPFFTTKRGGQGIGLLFVREVFHRHHFPFRISSNGHDETQFDLWLH